MWVAALRQTAGRGRRGRDWRTPEGNLAATLLMTTDRPPVEAAQVSFIAALAAHDLAETVLGPGPAAVKWPNDLLVHGRKAAGILVESGPMADGGLWLAVGIGVNLRHYPTDVERPATAFAEHTAATPLGVRPALELLAGAFAPWLDIWRAEGFAPIAAAWTARAYGLGQRCEVRLPAETFNGVALGLDPDGALRLRMDDGQVRRVTAGDVFFGEP